MTASPAVLGVDPSQTATGVAIIVGGPRHINWPVLVRDVGEQGHRTDTWAQRSNRIVAQVRRIMAVINDAAAECDYRLAVIEGPAYASHVGNAFDRAAVFWGVFSALHAHQIPIAVIPPTVRAQFATGKGHADKKLVLAETRALWSFPNYPVGIANDNQADALTLAAMGVIHLGWTLPFKAGLRRRHVENVAKCEWPKVVDTQ